MMYGKTPFYDKNRKLMFYRIINTPATFPSAFSRDACEVLRGLLTVNEATRLGAGPGGAADIRTSRFFSSIDFDMLFNKELPPPFTPEVATEFDTKYVPKAYLATEAKDSYAEPMKRGQKEKFDAFTFEGDKSLGGLNDDLDEGEQQTQDERT
jgi:hypothetical protein